MTSTANESDRSPSKVRLDLMKFEELGAIYDNNSYAEKRRSTNFLSVKLKSQDQAIGNGKNIKRDDSLRKKGILFSKHGTSILVKKILDPD